MNRQYTIAEYCEQLDWGISDLMREARVSYPTAEKAFKRTATLSRATRRDICSALSRALGRNIAPGDVLWTEDTSQ